MVDQPRPNPDGSPVTIEGDPDVNLLMYRLTVRYANDNLDAYVYEHFVFSTDLAALHYLRDLSNSGTILGGWLYRAEWCILNLNDSHCQEILNGP